mmetsp:Transcript_10680/g.22555  ORF Transcript_10680/g.22555 Transcript_10680/m.22555 type:complete len:206 (-) Transcript_10680:67-684(-)
MSTLSESEIGKNLNSFFLFFDRCLDQILNRKHSQQFSVVDQRQVTDIGSKHLFHTGLNRFIRFDCNKLAACGGNFLDLGFLRGSAEQGDFGNVVTFTDDSGQFTLLIDSDETSNVVSCELLDSFDDHSVFFDSEFNIAVSTQRGGFCRRGDIANAREPPNGDGGRERCGACSSSSCNEGRNSRQHGVVIYCFGGNVVVICFLIHL